MAIVHEWFTGMRGGEKCVEALCELFPDASLFTLVHRRGSVSPTLERMPLTTSFIQHLPFAAKHYRHYLPLFPLAVRRFDLREFECVISSHHCVAKGVRTAPHTLHLCYCYTPMRYLWDQYDEYFGPGRSGLATRLGMRLLRRPLRRWDVATASNPHAFIAISEHVRRRIGSIYRRSADVVYPPVDTGFYGLSLLNEGWLLMVSALVPYKRVDLAIAACNATGERLVIAGDGPDMARLRALAGPTVSFTGWVSDDEIRELYGRCAAVLFPGEEDFGIVPLEAMASGKPVVAFARGGALETVLEGPSLSTGVLFSQQTVPSLADALRRFRARRFDPQKNDAGIHHGALERVPPATPSTVSY
jgi:glycosyltransferase involved in cell wall biosynthesis